MARYLLDSDVLIWVLRNRQETVSLLQRLVEETGETLACSALSILEIWSGTKPSEAHRTAVLLESLDAIPITAEIARAAAELLKAHRRSKTPHEWVDALIAATALDEHLTLVTYNQRDYPYRDLVLYPLAS